MPKKKKVEEEMYHVEVITKARVSKDGEWEYLVKWAGYDSDADSWEPTENVQQCERLLASFWKYVGMDDKDYPIGYEVAAGEDWIAKEKRYFAATFVKPSKQNTKNVVKKNRQERRKSRSSSESHASESTNDIQSSDEDPPAKASAAKKQDRMAHLVDTESDSEPDDHLQKARAAPRPKTTTQPFKRIPKPPAPQEPPLRAGGSVAGASSKVASVRTHQDQRDHPLVKAITLSSKSVEAGSSLSTKQRVAAGILPPSVGPPKPLASVPKKSLPSFSFKKIKQPVVPTSETKDTASTSIATPASPINQSKDVVDDVDIVASPQPMNVDHPVDLFDTALDDAIQPGGSNSPQPFTIPMPSKSQEDINVDRFLQTIEVDSPLEMAAASDLSDPFITELGKTVVIPRIPKKWKWSGDLFISTSENKPELLCGVTISDPSATSNSSHINLLLSSLDSLQILKLYSILDLSFLLQACGKSQYFGKLESNEPNEDAIHGLGHHLTTEGLAAAIPLLLDDSEVAVLVVFSEAQQNLTKKLEVPEPLLSEASLLVVLLPFSVSAKTSINCAGWKPIDAVMQAPLISQDISVPSEPSQKTMLWLAMSLLQFPKGLLDFLNNPSISRAYCIWPLPQVPPGIDTSMLQCILKSTKAILTKPEEDVRVVFISSGHLEALHTMPSLVTKRANSPEVQFWIYGPSSSMAWEEWRVQEIYPLGGIVTFTCSALREDPIGCQQLMSQIIDHPLWDCYLIPEVLAGSHLLCNNMDLSSPSVFHMDSILDLITEGQVSVIRMPKYSDQVTWLSQIFHYSDASGHELLKRAFESHPFLLDLTSNQLVSFTNDEIIKDLSSAQTQPALMKDYRRFTVIRATSEDTIPFDKDGLEWSSLSSFSFKDDYFQP